MNQIIKRSLPFLCVAGLSVPQLSQADTILGLYAGAQLWNIESTGTVGSDGSEQGGFNYSDEAQGSFYIALEHPVPLIPNFKVKQTNIEIEGRNDFEDNEFIFGSYEYQTDTHLSTNLSHTDFILYYEILDNGLISIDLGVNIKSLDGDVTVTDKADIPEDSRSPTSTQALSGYIPMGYLAVEAGLPFTGFSVFGDMSVLSVNDQTLQDYQVGIAYEFIDNAIVDVDFQVGYRSLNLELDDFDNVDANIDFKGIFAGLEVHF